MAQKRMFDKSIIETDEFLDMGMATKALYFLLGMEADDEGFVSPKRVMRIYGGNDDDLKVLQAKGFVIQFKSGVVVITDWKENNYLDKNRIKETRYQAEKKLLTLDNNRYQLLNKGLTDVEPVENRREEYRIEEKSIEESRVETISYGIKDKELTEFLYLRVKENFPFVKDKTEKQKIKDYEEMNKINRIDDRTYDEIEFIINFSQSDAFWKQNIRSVAKLRKQFENLAVKSQSNLKGKQIIGLT
jgi:hypothetical protein